MVGPTFYETWWWMQLNWSEVVSVYAQSLSGQISTCTDWAQTWWYVRTCTSTHVQVWARLEVVYIWPDFDLGWSWQILFSMFVSYSPHIQVYSHQVWAQLQQVEILPDLWPQMTLTNVILNVHCKLPSHLGLYPPNLKPIGASWNFSWLWPWMTLTNLVLNVHFLMFISYSCHVQLYFHQVWTKLKFDLTCNLHIAHACRPFNTPITFAHAPKQTTIYMGRGFQIQNKAKTQNHHDWQVPVINVCQ